MVPAGLTFSIVTVMTKEETIQLAKQIATEHGLSPALVCAVIEQESGWNTWSQRFEPAFYDKYIAPHYPQRTTESIARATSYGLMQVMGATARELGFSDASMVTLCNERTGIYWGCMKLESCLQKSKQDETSALLKYNGGSNKIYPSQVAARKSKYS
jgi:soluble lytic murein transglycosylase-like protein